MKYPKVTLTFEAGRSRITSFGGPCMLMQCLAVITQAGAVSASPPAAGLTKEAVQLPPPRKRPTPL
jgi:hypothetical protein